MQQGWRGMGTGGLGVSSEEQRTVPLATTALLRVLAQVQIFPQQHPRLFIWSLLPSSSSHQDLSSACRTALCGNQIRKSQKHYKTCLV